MEEEEYLMSQQQPATRVSDYTSQKTSLLNEFLALGKTELRNTSPETQQEQYLNDDFLEDYLVKTRGGTTSLWQGAADNIAYHESGAQQRMDPTAIQISERKDGTLYDGPGRGMFQFESKASGGSGSLETAIQRYINVANTLGKQVDPEIINASSAENLNSDQQYALFYANMIEGPAKLADFATGKMPLVDLWLQGHKKVEKDGNRASFKGSYDDATNKGISYVQPRNEIRVTPGSTPYIYKPR